MYSRLQLARDLLSDDGVIFISIDDNEQANLKLLCDDVFGEENFISTLTVENNPKGRKNSSYVSVSSEFCVCYCKD
ncbi:DNA methyltransferase, partial [Enterococcus faecalis]